MRLVPTLAAAPLVCYNVVFLVQCCNWWKTCFQFVNSIPAGNVAVTGNSHLRMFSNWFVPRAAAGPQISRRGPLCSQAEGGVVFQQLPWQYQQVRTRKRGTEYQPKNIKRKRTHGWIKRMSSQTGIEVVLRRMLKGRKSLSHWWTLLENLKPSENRHWFSHCSGCSANVVYWVHWLYYTERKLVSFTQWICKACWCHY